MSKRDEQLVGQLLALVILGAALVALAACYVLCFVAIHTTILFGASTRRAQTPPLTAGIAVGLLVGAFWTGIGALTMRILTDAPWWLDLGSAVPLGMIVGWQVGERQVAVSWARSRGSLVLGTFRRGRFLVEKPYTVTAADRLKHLAVTGPTGSGKTTLVRNLIVSDFQMGAGVCVIDVKDDLVTSLLGHVPADREGDVILFDPSDAERPVPFNPFAGVPPERRSIAAAELLAVFRRYFADAWGARLEHIFRNVILALLEVPGASLADVSRLLLDHAYLQWALGYVSNPTVREFFLVEYETVLRRRGDALEPILNKIGPWLTYPELRRVIEQPEATFDVRQVMDQGKILLVQVPEGAVGEDISSLLAGLFVAKIQLAAHSRVDTPPEHRRPFHLYVDEWQRFATSSFERVLTEARSFGLGLVCANQYPEQLSRDLRLAIEHNVATRVQCDYRRGHYLADVDRLDGTTAFVVTPPKPLTPGDAVRAERVRDLSRNRYGVPAAGATAGNIQIHVTDNGRRRTQAVPAGRADIDEE